ncbi:MAG: response regulator transcription factor [Terracidiphilus sp.]|jgi:two-component system, NarL family, nitrate/nitrite response regulator NarL
MRQIRILMVDDHSLFREGLSRLLETTPDFQIVGQCATVAEAVSALSETPADVVLLDYDLGDEQGYRLLVDLRNRDSTVKVLMVTAGMTDTATLQIMEAGASGVFLKHSDPDQLVAAIHRVANDEIWMDTGAVRSLVAARNAQTDRLEHTRPLTSRQSEVLRGIFDGLANKEIAWKLNASESSIKAVIQELFRKAGVRTRSQLVRIAIEKYSSDWLNPELKD